MSYCCEIAGNINFGCSRKVSDYIIHHNRWHTEIHRSIWEQRKTPVYCWKNQKWTYSINIKNVPWNNERKWLGLINYVFLGIIWVVSSPCISYLQEECVVIVYDIVKREAGTSRIINWEKFDLIWSLYPYGSHVVRYHLLKQLFDSFKETIITNSYFFFQ